MRFSQNPDRTDRSEPSLASPRADGERLLHRPRLGNPISYTSAFRGAGRRMSRGARRNLDLEGLDAAMAGKAWHDAETLIDEGPRAYKPIDDAMAAPTGLVAVEHRSARSSTTK